MKNLKKIILAPALLLLGLLSINSNAIADNNDGTNAASNANSASLLVYINPIFYDHPIRLLHPYLDYWHLRGPMFEKIALKTLNNNQISAQSCQPNLDANLTISLEPYMFYNPQMRIFHSEVIAKVYAGKLEPIATYKATAEELGELNNVADYYLKRAYAKAMQSIVTQMQADTDKIKFNNGAVSLENNLCTLLNTLPTTRRYF